MVEPRDNSKIGAVTGRWSALYRPSQGGWAPEVKLRQRQTRTSSGPSVAPRGSYWVAAGTLLCGLLLPAVATADQASEAAVLHAEALSLTLDGEENAALKLLRQAAVLDPQSLEIAFERARLSLGLVHPVPADLEAYLLLPAQADAAHRKLRLSILAQLGRIDEAEEQPVEPTGDVFLDELLSLAQTIRTQDRAPSWTLDGRASLGLLADSNVTLVTSDSPSRSRGVALGLDLDLRAELPRHGLLLQLFAELARHLNNRASLGEYDSVLGRAQLSWQRNWSAEQSFAGISTVYIGLYGDMVRSDLFANAFMEDVGMVAELRFGERWRPGLYVDVARRNFVDDASFAVLDRDGLALGTGLSLEVVSSRFAATLRAGIVAEETQGVLQKQRGVDASLFLSLAVADLYFVVGLSGDYRKYIETRQRVDRRVRPQAEVRYAIGEHLALRAGADFTHNNSTNGRFSYRRLVTSVRVEGEF